MLNSRWLKAEDFLQTPNPLVNAAMPLFNLTEIQGRATAFVSSFNTDVVSYFNALPVAITNDTQLSILRNKLATAAAYGIDFAVTDVVYETFAAITDTAVITGITADLRNLGLKVKTEAGKRYAEAGKFLTAAATATDEEVKVKAYADALNAIFGNGFKVLPHFSFSHYTGLKTDVDSQLTTNTTSTTAGIMRQYQPNDVAVSMEDWLYGLGRVQEKMADVETVRMLAADDNNHPLKDIRPVQFPYVAANTAVSPAIIEDYWLGLPYPSDYEPAGDKTSIAIFNYSLLAATSYGYYAGLVIDEWTEMIPAKEIMSGIGFNYDQPNAKPPQTVLLAVSPKTSGTWTLEDMWYVLLDTMEMSKIRMVEPDHFRALPTDSSTDSFEVFKWLLPAVVGEVTPHVITVPSPGTYNHTRYQSADSIQQVSFEYNPVNDPVPVTGGINAGVVSSVAYQYPNNVSVGVDWANIDADNILGNADVKAFAAAQYALANIAVTQGKMATQQASVLYDYKERTQQNPQG